MDAWLEHFAATAFRRSADTAHDLKTPLNVAVLSLELLKMRLAKLLDAPDEKIAGYAAAIETELRRMARIFDTFFLLSTPPSAGDVPVLVDVAPLCGDDSGPALVRGHDSRIREAVRMFFDGAAHLFGADSSRTVRRAG